MVMCSDGVDRDLLPVGTRVRHTKNPRLTGRIKCWEMHDSGTVSPIPYNVDWDDNGLAARLLGWMWIYASETCVERIEDGDD